MRTLLFHREARLNNVKAANRAFDQMLRIREEMRKRGPSVYSQLLKLLRHESPWVRCDAAIPMLFFAPNEAEVVLNELAKTQERALGTIAEMTLKEWRKGTLKQL